MSEEEHLARRTLTTEYVVVHVVCQESTKPLVESQVVDHMEWQATAPGEARPRRIMILFLEPLRVAMRSVVRRHVRALQRRAPHVRIVLLPYISRLGMQRNSRLIASWLVRWARTETVVFHCRNEAAIDWARYLVASMRAGTIVADIRGPRPLELLFDRGYADESDADNASALEYRVAAERLGNLLKAATAVTTVSPGMKDWLVGFGLDREKISYVPCCVGAPTFVDSARARIRGELSLDGKLVIAYVGVAARYQHLENGVIPFVREAILQDRTVFFLAITPDTVALEALLRRAGVPADCWKVVKVPQAAVGSYLSAADAGLLLRPSDRLSSVVQPVKLGEYLAAGLPVIVSDGAGAVGEMIRASGAGVVTDYSGDNYERLAHEVCRILAQLRDGAKRMRVAALTLCNDHFVWSRYTNVVRSCYLRSIERGPVVSATIHGAKSQ